MKFDIFIMILMGIALGLSSFMIISVIMKNIAQTKELQKNIKKIKEMEIKSQITESVNSKIVGNKYNTVYFNNFALEAISKRLIDNLCIIYPDFVFDVMIMLVADVDANDPTKNKVIKYYSYPEKECLDKQLFTIKENTDFNLIIGKNKKYFFVSDLKKFSAIEDYKNEDKNYLRIYNTSIVYPVFKDNQKDVLLAFLCISSPQQLNDIKKNELVIDVVEEAVSSFKETLPQKADKHMLSKNK